MRFSHCADPFARSDWRHILERAVARFGSKWEDLDDGLRCGNATLWLAETDRVVAALVCRRDGSTMEVWLAGGAVLSGCVPFLEIVEREAAQYGMTDARITGRNGWDRVLKPWGWRRKGDDLVKELVADTA